MVESRAAALPVPTRPATQALASLPFAVTPLQVIAIGYAAVALILLARLATGIITARRIVQRARQFDSSDSMVRVVAADVGIHPASLRESRDVCVPVTVGWFSPHILVPPEWDSWTSEQKQAVLRHELTHIARGDFLIGMAARLNCCMYWFHPLSWLLARRVAALAELCCDDAVIAGTMRRTEYARHLLTLAAAAAGAGSRVQIGVSMARPGGMQRRVAAILDENRSLSRRLPLIPRLGLTAFAVGLVLTAGSLRATSREAGVAADGVRNADSVAAPGDVPTDSSADLDRGRLLAAWKARQEKCSSYRVEFRLTRLDAAASIVLPRIRRDTKPVPPAVWPQVDTEYSSSCTLMVDGLRSRFTIDGKMWWFGDLAGEKEPTLVNRKETCVFDGTVARKLQEAFLPGTQPNALIWLQKSNPALTQTDCHALQWFLRPLDRKMGGFDPESIRVLDERAVVDGFECVAVLAARSKDEMRSVWRLWVDPAATYAIRRAKLASAGSDSPMSPVEVSYKVDPNLGWFPANWVSSYSLGGRVRHKTTGEVTGQEINVRAADADFRVDFPEGTQVRDYRLSGNASGSVPVSEGSEPAFKTQPAKQRDEKPDLRGGARSDPHEASKVTIGGRVVTEDGRGIGSAHIWLRDGRAPQAFRFVSATTDDQGRFRFPNVPPESVTVTAIAQGYCFGGVHRFGLSAGVVDENLRIVLKRPAQLPHQLANPDGQPIAGADVDWIHWHDDNSDDFWLLSEVLKREGIGLPRSDEQGLIKIENLPPFAAVTMRIKHPDYARQVVEAKVAAGRGPVPVTMQRGSPLFVEVADAATGEAVPDARVNVSGIPNTIAIFDEQVDAQGVFTTRLGDVEHVTVSVSHPTLLARKPSVLYRGWNPTDAVGERLRFELVPRAKVSGRVLDQNQQPIKGVTVALATDRVQTGRAATDENGRYEMEGPAGWGEVSVQDRGGFYAQPRRTLGVDLSPERPVEAGDLFARRIPPVRGVVVLPDGSPAAGAFVTLPHSFPQSSSFANDEGRFEMSFTGFPHGLAHFAASDRTERRSGRATVEFETLLQGQELRIELQPEAILRGILRGPDGTARAAVRVQLWTLYELGGASTMARDRATVTDEQGRFHFSGRSPNLRYRVTPFTETIKAGDWQVIRQGQAVKWVQLDEGDVEIEVRAQNEADLARASVEQRPAPAELVCRTWINGEPQSLAALRGKVVLLNFWGIRGEQSISQLPTLQRAHEIFASQGLVVIGVHCGSASAARVQELVRKQRLAFPIGLDGSEESTAERYGVIQVPAQVLIGRDGRVISTRITGHLWAAIRRAVLYGEGE
ncbi:MAG: carboxypeptidase regulatory-like domain-containing protein [Deltaproteobacteria bacterium]